MTKYIFVTGGVVSGLGKGITAASLGRLLKMRGLKVAAQKLDPYINVDPGTMSPYQHGEVYVTEDGAETDLDLGHAVTVRGRPASVSSSEAPPEGISGSVGASAPTASPMARAPALHAAIRPSRSRSTGSENRSNRPSSNIDKSSKITPPSAYSLPRNAKFSAGKSRQHHYHNGFREKMQAFGIIRQKNDTKCCRIQYGIAQKRPHGAARQSFRRRYSEGSSP